MARELTFKIEVEIGDTEEKLRRLDAQLDELAESASKGSISMDKFEEGMRRNRVEYEKQTQKLGDLREQHKQASSSLDQLTTAAARYVAPAVLGAAITKTMAWADNLADLSAKTGVSIKGLQQLEAVAAVNGTTMDTVARSVQMLGDRLAGREDSAMRAVQDLGLSLDELVAMRPEDAFVTLAQAVAGIEDPMRRQMVQMDLFGRTGRELGGVIEDLANGLDKDLPAASDASVKALAWLKDQMDLTWQHMKANAIEALGTIVAAINGTITASQDERLQQLGWIGAPIRLAGNISTAFAGLGELPTVKAPGIRNAPLTAPAAPQGKDLAAIVTDLNRELRETNRVTSEFESKSEKARKQWDALSRDIADINRDLMQAFTGKPPGQELSFAQIFGQFGQLPFVTGAMPTPGATMTGMLYGTPGTVAPGGMPAGPGGFLAQSFGGAQGFGAGLSQTVLGSLMGGGNIGQSIGSFFGGGLMQGAVKQFSTTFSKTFLGGALSSILPGIGSLLGPALGWLGDKLFGGEAKKTRQMRDQWLEAAGGLDAVRKMAEYAGVSVDRLLSTKKTKTFEAEVKRLEAAFKAVQERVQTTIGEVNALSASGGLMSGKLAKLVTQDLDKPEVQAAFKAFVETNLRAATDGLTAYLKAAKDLPLSAKSAEALGSALAGVWRQSMALGMTARQALAALKPAIDELTKRLEAAGLTGGAAFDALREQADLAAGEITGPLIDGVDGLTQAMVGLANAGILTEDMFKGLAEQVAVTYDELIKQGVGAEAALRAIAPSLQRVWELQQKYGWSVDDATQKLINQGIEAGIVGEQMKDPLLQILDVLKEIAKALGVTIPEAAGKATEAMDRVRMPKVQEGETERPDGGRRMEYYAAGSGGVRDFGGGTLAMLHGREAVLTEGQLRGLLDARGGGTTVNISIAALDTQSVKQAVDREVIPALIDLYRGNVRGSRTATREALGVA